MSRPLPSPSRRRFVQGSAAAAIAPFFIGRPASAFEAEFTMKIATAAPPETPWANQMKGLKALMWEGSNKRLKVKPYLGAALGGEQETVDAVKRGAIQCYGGSVSALASAVPEVACIELPYLFKNEKKADKVIDDAIFQDLDALLWSRGFKLFFFSENGFRSIGSTFPITSMKDLKGRKMRSQESDEHLDTWKAFGASPVPIAVTEVLPSLQTGVVDGFDNTPLFAFAASWYQGVQYFTLTEHIYQPGIVVLSRKWYETLPIELQELFTGKLPAPPAGTKGSPDIDEPGADGHGFISQAELSRSGRKGVRAIKGQLLENFRTAGITVNTLADGEMAAFRVAAVNAHIGFANRASPEGKALFKKITDAL